MNKILKLSFTLLLCLTGVFALHAQTPQFQMTTNLGAGQPFTFAVNYGTMVTVDWGDGVKTEYPSIGDPITGTLKGNVVTVSGYDITMVDCASQQLSAIDVTAMTDLNTLLCQNNQLQALDVTGNINLRKLNCSYNKLTGLTLGSKLTGLLELVVNNNEISTLSLTYAKSLYSLVCNDNKLASLSLTYNTKLKTLWCQNNQLTTLNVSKCTLLETLIAYNNQIATVNVSGLTKLTDFWCDINKITALNLSTNTSLAYLSADNCSISNLTVGSPFSVKSLYLNSNNLGFSGLPSVTGIESYKYAPQNNLLLPETAVQSVDLSAQLATLDNVATNASFKWFNGSSELVAGQDYTESNGVFTFTKEFDSLYCQISSALFPELPMITTSAMKLTLSTGIENNQADNTLNISVQDGKLVIKSTQPQAVRIYTLTGSLVKNIEEVEGVMEISLPKGVYIVNQKKVVL